MTTKYGVYIGRFSPIHLGHQMVIKTMLEQCGPENSLIIIGSCNQPWSLRNFFSYAERRQLIRMVYPKIRLVGLPDYPDNDTEWLLALDDILHATNLDPLRVVYYGGCEEDIHFFVEAGRKCAIINRFDGSSPKISATEIRDALISGRPLHAMVDPIVQVYLTELFKTKWENFRHR